MSDKDKEKKTEAPKKKDEKQEEEELSEEDQELKTQLELMVERAKDIDEGVASLALSTLQTEIKSSTASMTSVPKPLKFLRPHYEGLKAFFEELQEGANKQALADILSILAMTMAAEGTRESLNFKLKGQKVDIGSWGHEYVRNLAGEIGHEFQQRQQDHKSVTELLELVEDIVPFNMKHNAEPEACDLLMEVEQLERLLNHVDENNFERVVLYLKSCADYVPEPEDAQVLKIALEICKKMGREPASLQLAIRLNDMDEVNRIYENCKDRIVKQQLGFILARQNLFIEEEDEELVDIINNTNLSERFLALAGDLEILEPKTPEDIYKSHSSESRTQNFGTNVDSARQNLASTFVNAFVNAAFGTDKLMTDKDIKWIYKNKEHGMMSAAASLGMILLWDVDGGLSEIDTYLYSQEDMIKAGALLGVGVVNSGVRNECDPALALLSEYIESTNVAIMRIGAILGLGIAYAGSYREDLQDLLIPIFDEEDASIEVISITALALGMIFVGTANGEISSCILQVYLEKDETSLKNTHTRFLSLGLGLLFLAKQEEADVTLETLKAISGEVGLYASLTVETCAYAGTGNVLKVQKFLAVCAEHPEDETTFHQGVAVLGIAMVAMGEDLGRAMAVRAFNHLLQYADPIVRRAVPIALGFLYIGDPEITVMDTLSKLSHDQDEDVAQGAIFALGLIGTGTNNARAAKLLANLSSYYFKAPNHLFVVRLAQGLLHMGKGTLSASPYHSQGLMHRVAVSGLLTVMHSLLDIKNHLLGKSHYMLYTLVCAIYPRMLTTFDEELNVLNVPVRVGKAVDVVGQAGHPKTITGFQTHTTPVLIGHGERAELATEDYKPVASTLEGFVILRKVEEEELTGKK
eukprot:CAMPEP_0174261516 /NCGR_PEP_ID=MMETSP0439-20130205/11469_1 /TAXON_ID=0 /ORGANISM="Stereomyxa ramosa, Strain Chinc5" /LENGTH=866 /DNA_ID=CAMNT_0015345999 /DNA_START=24 /DNA_END=2624 /DNA_ORIENTATION=+